MIGMIGLILTFSLQASGALCSREPAPPADYTQIKKQIDLKMLQFSNKKPVAKKADETLSKLIAAKSPFVSSWMKKHTSQEATDEEIARIWRQYFARNFVLTTYPSGDPTLNKEIESLADSITTEYATKLFRERMQKLFLTAQSAALETVKSFPISEEAKSDIRKRVQAIKLYWPLKFKTSRNNKIPLDIIAWGIAYDPQPNEINMGVNAMAYPNDSTYIAVFAHEIGHAFDSCRWGAFFKHAWPFQKIGECLRTDKSVGAKTRDDGPLDKMAAEKKLDKQFFKSMKDNPTCNKLAYPPAGTQADQLPESFADWFSAEVMGHTNLPDVESLRVDLCEKRDLVAGSSYPTNELRLKHIYFAQPQLKAKLGLSAGEDPQVQNNFYCSLRPGASK
jgi:hypothetical protein